MIKLLNSLPSYDTKLGVAVSGGVDSMVALNFLLRGKRKPTIFYFNHGTDHGNEAEAFLRDYCEKEGHDQLVVGRIDSGRSEGQSLEEFWREERYKFFNQHSDHTIVMAHHLDDCLETWLFSSFHGCPKVIPYQRQHVIRPFLLNKKEQLIEWAKRYGVEYIHDNSNDSFDHMRNRIRHKIVPEVLKVNPGIHKRIKNLVLEQNKETE